MKDETHVIGDGEIVELDEDHRFTARYDDHRRRADRALESFLRHSLEGVGDCATALKEAVWYAVFPGGQRLRPVLVQEACEVAGGCAEAALPLACAVELIHSYSLVHDDLPCMDDDDFRRGRPTVHRAFGEAVAVLAGDLLLTLAFGAVAGMPNGFGTRLGKIVADLVKSAGWHGMLGGQAMDMAISEPAFDLAPDPKTTEPTRDFLRRVYALKTGKLFEASLILGGFMAGAGSEVCTSLKRYGYHFGLAYQIADDICDYDPRAGGGRQPNYVKSLGLSIAIEDLESAVEHCIRVAGSLGERAWFLAGLPTRVLERVYRTKGLEERYSISRDTDGT